MSLVLTIGLFAASPAQARPVVDVAGPRVDRAHPSNTGDGQLSSRTTCTRPRRTVDLVFSAAKYPNIRAHFLAALDKGWPRILVINRKGADDRRDRLLRGIPTKPEFDRDEYPPAVGRGAGRAGLKRGRNPTGWRASVMYVPSSENQSHGARLGRLLSPWCNGTRFRYVFA